MPGTHQCAACGHLTDHYVDCPNLQLLHPQLPPQAVDEPEYATVLTLDPAYVAVDDKPGGGSNWDDWAIWPQQVRVDLNRFRGFGGKAYRGGRGEVMVIWPNGQEVRLWPDPDLEDVREYGGPAEKLAQWWRDTAEAEIAQTVAKAVEYGAGDLIEIGRQVVDAGVKPPWDRVATSEAWTKLWEAQGINNQAYYAELGIWFYLVGKMARWKSAIEEGRLVSTDTMLDIGVYVRMAQRVRQAGGWPGV